MLFVFYILVFLIINYSGTNCFILRDNDKVIKKYTTIAASYDQDDIQNKINVTTTKEFFQMIQNLTRIKSSDLKSNVFDKMLSDEMLAIKRNFYENDLSQVSLQLSDKVSAPTPTLEIKQKWPYTQCDYSKVYEDNEKVLKDNKIEINKTLIGENVIDDITFEEKLLEPYDKILGLRSLPEGTPVDARLYTNQEHVPVHRRLQCSTSANKLCTCMKTKSSVICSQRCTGNIETTQCCTHSINSNACHQCTQTVPSYTTCSALYVTYPNYFLGMSTIKPYKNYYYPSNVIGDMKLPKKSHRRKTTRRYDNEDLYYDYKNTGNDYNDRYIDEFEDSRTTNTKIDKEALNINVDYDEKKSEQTMPNKIQEKLVNQVVKDLKMFYSDAVIKDCYCSSMSVVLELSYLCVFLNLVSSFSASFHYIS